MKRVLFVLPMLAIFINNGLSQAFTTGFSFNLPYNDTTTAEFLPQFPKKAITDQDYVTTDSLGSFIVNGKPYRFYGVNLTTQAAFPSKIDAPLVAGRMRKLGINLVRFHHIDNPWSDGSLFYNVNGTRTFNSGLRDRLEYFIAQLKANGIYVNMNLNVSRTFEKIDGVVDADSLSDFGKGVTQFDTVMIALQKEYAKMLLGHVNPYTGIKLAEDPVLAMVETINENSLFRMWYAGDLRLIRQGGKLPVYYNNQLDSLWQDYLTEQYDSTKYLAQAWSENATAGDTLFFDGFESGIGTSWNLELHNTAAAIASVTSDGATGNAAALVKVTAKSTETWHTQFKFTGGSVSKDSIYEVLFKAKAGQTGSISVTFMRDNSPWTYYSGHTLSLDSTYREFKLSFKAPEDNTGYLRIGFSFQNDTGSFYFDDFLFRNQNRLGLLEHESLEQRNVTRISIQESLSYTPTRTMDLSAFFIILQRKFLTNMHTWIRDTLGVAVPITGTNWFTGPEDVYVQNIMDYIDNHAYWDHPNFPGEPWSPTNWTINNKPMMTSESGTLESLFNGLMVKNKPYTVSEYNHCFPNQFQAEFLPMITAYLSYNDADGLMVFTYSGSWTWAPDFIENYFDTHRNTNLMASYPLFSYAFRNYLISPSSQVIEIPYSYNDILHTPLTLKNWWSTHYPYDQVLATTHRLELTFDAAEDFNANTLPDQQNSPFTLADGQIYWDKSGLFKINTPKFCSISGYLNEFANTETAMMTLASGSDFGSVTWLSLVDSALDQSSRSVVSIGSKIMNTGMVWEGTTTVHNQWGHSPTLTYPLTFGLKLKTRFPALIIYPLNTLGKPVTEEADTLIADEAGYVLWQADQKADMTLWYGIAAAELPVEPDDTTMVNFENIKDTIVKVFPVPANQVVHFEYPEFSLEPAWVRIYDLSGNPVCEQRGMGAIMVNTSALAPGIYFYQLQVKRNLRTGRIMIIR